MLDHDRIRKDEAIRHRLLTSLGIRKTALSSSNGPTESRTDQPQSGSAGSDPRPAAGLLSRDAPAFLQSLNDSHEEHSRKGHVRRPSRKRLVQFHTDVMVKPIASHKNYSKRIKQTLWADAEELQDNAYRNQVEFAAEGWDYEKVLEDEDMYMDAETGELVHPYWIENQGGWKQQQ
jgi:hypothetical protein